MTVFFITVINSIVFITSKSVKFASNAGTLLALITIIYLLFTKGPYHEGHIWLIVFPIIAFALNGKNIGLRWTVGLYASLIGIALLIHFNLIVFPYSIETITATLLATTMTSLTMYFYDTMLEIDERDQKKFELAADIAYDQIVITDPDAKVLYVNSATKRVTGFSPTEILGKKAGVLWGKQMSLEYYKKFWDTIKNKKIPFAGEINNVRKSGEKYTANIEVSPVLNDENKIIYFVGIERDITKEKESTLANERLAAIVRDTDEAIFSKDLKGIVLSWNRGAEEMYKFTPEEAIGKDIRDLIIPKDKVKEMEEVLAKVAKGERIVNFDTQRKRKDGTTFEVNVTFSPVHDETGEIVAVSVSARDVTKYKEVDRMKTEFVSLASHQLRTPLTSIKWYLEMILDKSVGTLNKDQEQYLTDVYQSNETMIKLVNALLNISRIESGRLTIEPKLTDLATLFRQVVERLKPQLAEGKLNIIDNIPGDLPKISIDPVLISNVYTNLLGNSIKYTHEGGTIEIKIEKNKDSLISSVKDTGVGIPLADQKHLFERFYRGSNVSQTSIGSTGLGLYLAKEVVEASGGTIWFITQEGKGSTFYFSLPLSGSPSKKGEVTLS
jgi:PAS domain S-box-containing protein